MMQYRTYFIYAVLLSVVLSPVQAVSKAEDIIQQLYEQVQAAQFQETTSSIDPPFDWAQRRGLYPSQVKINFVGKPEITMLRDYVSIVDNNMFVTNWILEILIESSMLGMLQLNETSVIMALEAIVESRDKNHPEYPIYSFWTQQQRNGTWIAWPENLRAVIQDEESFAGYMKAILDDLGLGYLWNDVAFGQNELESMAAAFQIPPDFDDTSCHLGLGSLLFTLKDQMPNAYNFWLESNTNITYISELLRQFAYRPFSNDSNANTIDPRTYFFLSDFLYKVQDEAIAEQRVPNLSLIPTWIDNIGEDQNMYNKGVTMPFNVNNLDLSVNANVLYGTTRYLLYGAENSKWFTEDLQNTLSDTASLMSWAVTSGRIWERPDLALLYYPPVYDFYWFVARSIFLLNNYPGTLPFQSLSYVQDTLTTVMRANGTSQLLKASSTEGRFTYWLDFLGQGDLGWFGEADPHPDDAMFSTAVAVNALLDIWTEENDVCKRTWIQDTPQNVIYSVAGAIEFLKEHALQDYPTYNSFFSGSMKGMEQMPFSFPVNKLEYTNGSQLPPNPGEQFITPNLIGGMSGVMEKVEYTAQLNQTHFGFTVPIDFTGFNIDPFPFWTSTPLTQSVTLLALSKHLALEQCKLN